MFLSLLQKKASPLLEWKSYQCKSKDNPALLKAGFELKLREVWRPQPKKKEVKEVPFSVIQVLNQSLETKKAQGYSERFINDAKHYYLMAT